MDVVEVARKVPWKKLGILLAIWLVQSTALWVLKRQGIDPVRLGRWDGFLSAYALLWLFPFARPWRG